MEALDVLDGTPLLDIKPYVPAFDLRPEASRGWVADSDKRCTAGWSPVRDGADERLR